MSYSNRHTSANHGEILTAISDGIVALLKEFYGRGPTRTKSYYDDDLVVCVLRGGFSRVEQTLLDGGRGAAVINQRMEFQELMRDRFTDVIEAAAGRPVVDGGASVLTLLARVAEVGVIERLPDS